MREARDKRCGRRSFTRIVTRIVGCTNHWPSAGWQKNRYDKGGERACFYDESDHGHVKFSVTRAPIHWWTWLSIVYTGALAVFFLWIGLACTFERPDWFSPIFGCGCCRRSDDETPLLGGLPKPICDTFICDVSTALYRVAWLSLALAVAFFGPSTWHGSHPGITSTQKDFDRTWSKWAHRDQDFLDHMVTHCDTLFNWTVVGIAVAEGLSLAGLVVRKLSFRDESPLKKYSTFFRGWLLFIDIPLPTNDEFYSSQAIWAVYGFSFTAIIARITVINGLLQWGEDYGGLSSYFVDSRNNVVHCCDPTVLHLAVTWIVVNITCYVLAPLIGVWHLQAGVRDVDLLVPGREA